MWTVLLVVVVIAAALLVTFLLLSSRTLPIAGTAAPDFSRSRAAVLAIYGELDGRVNATRDTAVSALRRAGLTYEVRTFPGADRGFFNDTGARYNATAAADAYRDVLDWFSRYLG